MTDLATTEADAEILEAILRRRRTVREFAASPLTDEHIHRLLWAAQGVTGPDGRRTAPSPHRSFGLQVLAVTPNGVVRYDPSLDTTEAVVAGDRRDALRAAAEDQPAISMAPVTLALAGSAGMQTTEADGGRAMRYLVLEAGHAGQNVLLEAAALGLVAVIMGKFDDGEVARVLELPEGWLPLELISVGHPRS